MPPTRLNYRSSWGNQFGTEPLSRYKETEKQRFEWLANKGLQTKLAERLDSSAKMAFPPTPYDKPEKGKWGSFKSALDKVTPESVERGGKKAWEVAQIPGDVTRGLLTEPLGDLKIGPDGKLHREYSWRSAGEGIKELAGGVVSGGHLGGGQERIKAETELAQRAGQQFDENPFKRATQQAKLFDESNLPVGVKVAGQVGLDPTTWIGPGAVGKALPKLAQMGRGGRLANTILGTALEGGGTAAAIKSTIGAGAAAQAAESAGAPDWVKAAAPLVGAIGAPMIGAKSVKAGAKGYARTADAIQAREEMLARKAGYQGSTEFGGADFRKPGDEAFDRGDVPPGGRPIDPEPDTPPASDVPPAGEANQGPPPREPAPPLDRTDSWSILGVTPDMDPADWKKAYRAKMRQYHPDVNPSATAAEDAKAINNAFDKLSQFGKREPMKPRGAQQPPPRQEPPPRPGADDSYQQQRAREDAEFRQRQQSQQPPPNGGFSGWAGARNEPPPGAGAPPPPPPPPPPPGAGTPPPGASEPPPRRPFEDWASRPQEPKPGPEHGPFQEPGNPGVHGPIRQQRGKSHGPQRREDLFDTITGAQRMREEAGFRGTLRGKVDAGIRNIAGKLGGDKLDTNLRSDPAVRTFLVKEKSRIQNMINSREGEADDLFAAVENSGIKLTRGADGNFRMENGVSFEDMVELKSADGRRAYADLTDAQQNAVDALQEFNERLNANLRFHSGEDLPWDDIAASYFPRVVKGINGKDKAYAGGDTAGIGTRQNYSRERTQHTFEEGAANKVNYANPREAYRIMTRAKLRAGMDEYMAQNLKPLGVTRIPQGGKLGVDWVQIPRDIAPALQGRFFPPEIAEMVRAAQTKDPSVKVKIASAANAVLTPARAIGDASWFAQQGAALLFRHPVKALNAAPRIIISAFGNRATYDKLIDGEKARAAAAGLSFDDHLKHGLHWVADDVGETDLTMLGKNIPGYGKLSKWSNETFGRYMNYFRLVFANDAAERLVKRQKPASPADFRKQYQGAMNAVNRMSGYTARQPTSLESIFSFAPRYFSSSIEQVFAAVSRNDLEGGIARMHIARMLAFGGLAVWGVNELNNEETDFDPRSSNFMRIKNFGFGGNKLDVSLFGTYDPLMRAIAGTIAGEKGDSINPLESANPKRLWKFAEGKMSPAMKLVYEPFIKGATYTGEPLDPFGSPKDFAEAAISQGGAALPFSFQNFVEGAVAPALKSGDPKDVVRGLPGVGVSFTGLTNTPTSPSELRNYARDKIANEKFGMDYEDLPGQIEGVVGNPKAIVNEDPKVVDYQNQANENTLTAEDDRSRNTEASLTAQKRTRALTTELDAGRITGSEFRDRYYTIQQRFAGSREVLEQRQDDPELEGWFKLYGDIEEGGASRPDGSMDRDLLEQLQAQYQSEHPGIMEKVDAITGVHDDATMRRFRAAQDMAKQYYEIPAFRVLNLEDSERATEVLRKVNRLLSNDQSLTRTHALVQLLKMGEIEKSDIALAIRASKLGSNPKRAKFKKDNPDYAFFYNDAFADAPAVGSFPNR